VNQAAGQGSQLISVYNFQGGTAYTAANMFTVYAGDKIHFTWKQSGWVQTTAQQSYVICYLVKGTNPVPQAGDRIEVGRIYEYIYFSSDHEEISGSFVYNVTSTFSFYRSQMEGAPNLVTQGQDYGAATATVYRATVPNSIVVPTLIDATNISVVNLSVTGNITTPAATITNLTIGSGGIFNHDLTNNLVAGAGISITSVGNKPLIGLNPNINVSNLSTINTSTTNISVLETITVGTGGNGGGVYAKNGTGVFSTGGFYFNNAVDGTGGNLNIFWTGGNVSAYGIGTLDGYDVRLANGYNTGGLVVSGTLNNINMSNCSITNLSADNNL
jgi:hypothetical protein